MPSFPRWPLLLTLLLCACSVGACARAFVAQGPVPLAATEPLSDRELFVQWLGTSSWIISRGRDVVVVDPVFSRPSFGRVAASLLFRRLAGDFGYNVERIRDVLPDLPWETKFLLIGHGHYDHLMDVAFYMMKKGGPNVTYVGGVTAKYILSGFRPDNLPFLTAEDGVPIQIPGVQVRVIPFASDHAPHFLGHTFMTGHLSAPLPSPPTTVGEYVEGETRMYLIDFLDADKTIQWRVFINSAASRPDKAMAMGAHTSILSERAPDVAIFCVPGWNQVADYPRSLLEVLRPRHVVLSHYDDFFSPYQHDEDPKAGMEFVISADYDEFIDRLRTLQGMYGFEFYEPKSGQCLRFPRPAGKLGCEK